MISEEYFRRLEGKSYARGKQKKCQCEQIMMWDEIFQIFIDILLELYLIISKGAS